MPPMPPMPAPAFNFETDVQYTIKIDESEPSIRNDFNDFNDTETICLAWRDLSYSVTNPKTKEQQKIINCVSGVVNPGEVMAIMGPSGAGKSTLLDLLAGRKDPRTVAGQVYLNGVPGNVKYVSTYVEQDDALIGVMTVRENIQYAADFCFPSSYSARDRRERVQAIIEDFGLERVADSRVGTIFVRGISGGEKRRTSIATQVITVPKVIFLDEPTTGLDSAAAYNVMKAIVVMARKFRLTVIASIHQPSTETYSLFDKLCLIARGRTVYMGDREGALAYFEDLGHTCPPYANPADHFLHLINSDFITEKEKAHAHITKFIDAFENSDVNSQIQSEIRSLVKSHKRHSNLAISSQKTTRYARGFFMQTYLLTKRSFKNAWRNVLLYWIRVAMYTALAILMGTAWWKIGYKQENINDRFSVHFFSVAFLAFMSVAGIPGFLEERAVFQRERSNGFYSVAPYVVANTITSIPFVAVISIAFSLVCYPMVGLHPDFHHGTLFTVYLFLALLVAESMVVFIAGAIPIFVAALTIAAFMNGFFMVVEGYFVRRDALPKLWKWAHHIDYQKYAFEALIQNDFVGLTFDCDKVSSVNGTDKYNCYYGDLSGNSATFTGQDVLKAYGYTEVKQGLWVFALIGLMLAFRFALYVALRLRKGRR